MSNAIAAPMMPDASVIEGQIVAALESYRDARVHGGGELSVWRPRNVSADAAVLKDAGTLRARARDLVRNNPLAKNAVRMNRDAVSGSGLKLALKIDWRTLGLKNIEAAAEWQDHVVRAWEAFAESTEFQADARRQRTFSQIFALVDQTDYVDGECLGVLEMKPGVGIYQTCVNLVDVDRLSTPVGVIDGEGIRGGIERDVYGEPIAYHIREGHPHDVGLTLNALAWKRVERQTAWGRPIVLHTYDHTRPEMTRGVSEFASVISTMRMLSDWNDTELQAAVVKASYAAYIKSELDWNSAMQVLGAQVASARSTTGGAGNPMMDYVAAHLTNAAKFYEDQGLTWNGARVPHLAPNESMEVLRTDAANANFAEFENAFTRKLAAGLGVEAHELSKNYADVNYSAARAALLSVWRTYRSRRSRLTSQFAMPFFGAWLEEAIAIGAVQMPEGVTADFIAVRPYLVRGTFVAWGKPMIDPMKERQAQQLGMQMGSDTLEDVTADDGRNWRDVLDQLAFERSYKLKVGLDPDGFGPEMAPAAVQPDDNTDGAV